MFGKIIRNIGIWGYLAFGVLAMLFVAGETMDDPGGMKAVWFIVAWLAPLALLVILVLLRTEYLRLIMYFLTTLVVVASVLTTFLPDSWFSFKNANGPVLGIASMVLTFAMALWARTQTRIAGMLMVLVTLTPLVCESIAMGVIAWGGSSVALMFPGVLAGGLIVLSTYVADSAS